MKKKTSKKATEGIQRLPGDMQKARHGFSTTPQTLASSIETRYETPAIIVGGKETLGSDMFCGEKNAWATNTNG